MPALNALIVGVMVPNDTPSFSCKSLPKTNSCMLSFGIVYICMTSQTLLLTPIFPWMLIQIEDIWLLLFAIAMKYKCLHLVMVKLGFTSIDQAGSFKFTVRRPCTVYTAFARDATVYTCIQTSYCCVFRLIEHGFYHVCVCHVATIAYSQT